jgi:23S rRNA pseudouridine2605 synthase
MQIRLNKFLADLGFASRRKADALIEAGQVLLNNRKAKLGDKIDPTQDKLVVEGKAVELDQTAELEYWLLNKPRQVLSAASDESNRKTVLDYLKNKTTARLYPVGRLDYDSEGLLLLTNDGELAQRLTHPKFEIPKVYKVWVDGIFMPAKIERLLRGVRLAEGKIAFDQIEVLEKEGREFILRITIHQGVKREIRRACAKVGWTVTKLLRTQMATLVLHDLIPGNVRKLNLEEIQALRQAVGLASE